MNSRIATGVVAASPAAAADGATRTIGSAGRLATSQSSVAHVLPTPSRPSTTAGDATLATDASHHA